MWCWRDRRVRASTRGGSRPRPAGRSRPRGWAGRSPWWCQEYVVDWRMTSCPSRRCLPTVVAAARTKSRTGVLVASNGVGTQRKIASALVSASGSVVASNCTAAASSGSGTSSMWLDPARRAATRASSTSRPMVRSPEPAKAMASGSPTYPRPTIATVASRPFTRPANSTTAVGLSAIAGNGSGPTERRRPHPATRGGGDATCGASCGADDDDGGRSRGRSIRRRRRSRRRSATPRTAFRSRYTPAHSSSST